MREKKQELLALQEFGFYELKVISIGQGKSKCSTLHWPTDEEEFSLTYWSKNRVKQVEEFRPHTVRKKDVVAVWHSKKKSNCSCASTEQKKTA